MVDEFGTPRAFQMNVELEYERNGERYEFLKWGQSAFDNFRVVPPGTGICHQVNLEYLGQTVWTDTDPSGALGRLSRHAGRHRQPHHDGQRPRRARLGRRRHRGRGGDARPADLDADPRGGRLQADRRAAAKAPPRPTWCSRSTQMLRKKGVVEQVRRVLRRRARPPAAGRPRDDRQHGAGVRRHLRLLPDRRRDAALPAVTGRDEERIALVEAYAKAQRLLARRRTTTRSITDTLALDMATVEPSLAGPKRPQDRVPLSVAAEEFDQTWSGSTATPSATRPRCAGTTRAARRSRDLPATTRGRTARTAGSRSRARTTASTTAAVVIAAITSCTNTSNPYVMIGAGLVARKARERGLNRKPWVKTSLAPGSQVVSDYLEAAGLHGGSRRARLQPGRLRLHHLHRQLRPAAGGDLQGDRRRRTSSPARCSRATATSRGAINPDVRANYLASPPLVVAYALAGDMNIDLTTRAARHRADRQAGLSQGHLADGEEIAELVERTVTRELFRSKYADVFKGDAHWQGVEVDDERDLRLAGGLDLRAEPALLPGHGDRTPGVISRHRGRADPGDPRRFGDHRPHLAGGLVQGGDIRPATT